MTERKNYQYRVGNRKVIAWNNLDKNGNQYIGYQLVKSTKKDDGTWQEETIKNEYADDLCIWRMMIDRVIATMAIRPTSFVVQDNRPPEPPPDTLEKYMDEHGIPY